MAKNKSEEMRKLELKLLEAINDLATSNQSLIVDNLLTIKNEFSLKKQKQLQPFFDFIQLGSVNLKKQVLDECRKRFQN